MAQANHPMQESAGQPNVTAPHVEGGLKSARDINLATYQTINHIAQQLLVVSSEVEHELRNNRFVDRELPSGGRPVFDPARLNQLSRALLARRLLIIFPGSVVPAVELAQHIAAAFQQLHQDRFGAPLPVREFAAGDGNLQRFDLLHALAGFEMPGIFLIPQATRQILGRDLGHIQRFLNQRGHWLLAVTEEPAQAWRLRDHERPVTLAVQETHLFVGEYLRETLHQELASAGDQLLPALVAEWRTNATIGSRTMDNLVAQLHAPLTIQAFVTLLSREKTAPGPEYVDRLVRQASGQQIRELVRTWFFSDLTDQQKLLAIGSAVFAGLRQEVFFIHLQGLLSEGWGLRDFRDQLIDHVDLKPILPFFSTETMRPGYNRIVTRYPQVRETLFEETYNDYQRHFQQAVNWLVEELLRESVLRGASQREGMQRPVLRDELRQVINEAISDLGLLNSTMVERPLLLLVGDQRNDALPTYVAQIIARWYERGHPEPFFRLVKRWRTGREPLITVRAWIRQYGGASRTDPKDALHACLVLMCAYAARSDRPGNLHPLLYEHLAALSESMGPLTEDCWQKHALPSLLPIHLQSLLPLLRRLTIHAELRAGIVSYLVTQSKHAQIDLTPFINEWYKQAKAATAYVPDTPIQVADTMLLTIVETLQQIPLDQARDTNKINVAKVLQEIAGLPRHPQVRQAAITASILHGTSDDAFLDKLFQHADDEAQLQATAEDLAHIYLSEREAQPKRDLEWNVGERTIPLSMNGARPLTAVERAIQRWLHNSHSPLAHKLALYTALAQVRLLDQAEDAYLAEQRRKAQEEAQNALRSAERSSLDEATLHADASLQPEVTRRPQSWFQDSFVPIFVTLDAPELRAPITHLLPIARRCREADDEQLAFLLNKTWQYQGEQMSALAERLAEALDLCERGWFRLNESDRALRTLAIIFREQPRFQLLVLNIVVAILIGLLLASFIFLR